MATTTKTTSAPTIAATIEGSTLTLAFSHGAQIVFRASDVNEDIRAQATMHGFKQKLVDAAAISRNPDTGRSATVQDKFDAVREVYDRLLAGEWNKVREGTSTGGLLLAALLRIYEGKKTRDQLVAFLASKTDTEQAALRNAPRYATVIAEIRAERAKAGDVDVSALEAELDAG